MSSMRPFAAALLILTIAPTAHAEDVAAAKMHYERGTTLFDLQRYTEAAKEYEAAFEAKNDPALLFNIGQAYRFAGDYPKAIAAYRSYLRRVPEAENRLDVQQRIAELQKLMDDQKKSAAPVTTAKPPEVEPAKPSVSASPPAHVTMPEPTPAEATPGRKKIIAGITLAAAGVASAVVGGVFEGLAKSDNDALSKPPVGATFDPSKESALKTNEVVGAVLLSIGGAALVTGVVVAILGVRERRARASVSATVSPQFAGISVHATF